MIAMNEKANGVKLFALVAVLAMVVAGAAVIMNDDTTDAATGTQVYGGQTLEETQTFNNVNIRVVEDLIIQNEGALIINGGNFTVDEGVTVTVRNGGSLTVNGGLVTVNGDIEVTGTSTTNVNSKFTVSGEPQVEDDQTQPVKYEDYGVVINGNLTVTRGGSIEAAENAVNAGVLVNNNGTLSIERVGNNYGVISGLNVDVAVGGTFDFNGAVGAKAMTVSAYGTVGASVTKVASSVEIAHSGNNDARDLSNLTFTTTSRNVTGYTYADGVTDSKLFREFAINVSGTVANNDEITFIGDAITGTYYTSEDAAKATNSQKYDSIVSARAVVSDLTVSATGDMTVKTYVQVTEGLDIKANDDSQAALNLTSGVLELVGVMSVDEKAIVASENGVLAVNGGSATIRGETIDLNSFSIYGAYYTDDSGNTPIQHIDSLANVIEGAVAAEADEVFVASAGIINKFDAYAITADLTVPANITLNIIGDSIVVAEGATLTLDADASVSILESGMIYVDGTIVDNSLNLEGNYESDNMEFQVKIVSEDGNVNTYTTLVNALAITQSGTIYLYNDVEVSGTLNIPAGVTVMYADNTTGNITFENKDATLVVDGIVVIDGSHAIDTAVDGENAKVTVNNMIKYGDNSNIPTSPYIDGAYFIGQLGEDDPNTNYLTSVAVAAENSANVEGTITVRGPVAMGDVTFTNGEDNALSVDIVNAGDDKTVATGNITLAGGTQLEINGNYTGNVTDGTTTIGFVKSNGAQISFYSEETAEGTVTEMRIAGTVTGEVTVSAGTAVVAGTATFSDLTIASGATISVSGTLTVLIADYNEKLIAEELPVYTEDSMRNTFGSFFIEGTLDVVQSGNVTAANTVIDGTVNVAERAGTVAIDGALINGTVNADKRITINIAQVSGTINGEVAVEALIVMPGVSVVEDDIFAVDSGSIESTTYYINGEEYATVYAETGTPIAAILIFADVAGVQIDTSVFYNDAAMTQEIRNVYNLVGNETFPAFPVDKFDIRDLVGMFSGEVAVGTYENVYIAMDPAEVEGTVSVGTGLDLYIDNVRVTGGQDFVLSVGTHTVSFDVKAGYDGSNATITFNGQTVQNGGSITITADMTEYTLVASGAAPSQGQVVIDQTGGDDGMGITDYLLIILVVLVIILAIFVALRMMRS